MKHSIKLNSILTLMGFLLVCALYFTNADIKKLIFFGICTILSATMEMKTVELNVTAIADESINIPIHKK